MLPDYVLLTITTIIILIITVTLIPNKKKNTGPRTKYFVLGITWITYFYIISWLSYYTPIIGTISDVETSLIDLYGSQPDGISQSCNLNVQINNTNRIFHLDSCGLTYILIDNQLVVGKYSPIYDQIFDIMPTNIIREDSVFKNITKKNIGAFLYQ